MRKLKVLQVNKLYAPFTGGVETVVQQIAEGLKDQADMKALVCNNHRESVTERINGVLVRRSGSFTMLGNMPLSVRFFRDLKKMSQGCDILHFHMPFPIGDLAGLLSGFSGKVVVWWHSDVVRQKKMMLLYRPVMEMFLKRADAIIVATQGHIDGSAYLAPYREKCRIIPYGVDPEIERQADQWCMHRQALEPSHTDRPVRFLFVGRLVYYKGCKVLLEAFCHVPNAELILIGDGVMKEELQGLVRQYGMESRVHFLGNVDDTELERQFMQCDVFVLPSIARSEAFGLVQIEAMSYEKPVINTNLPSGVPYVSLHKKTGLTVKPNDAVQLAAAMNWMVNHPKERERMGKEARKRAKSCFPMQGMLDQVLALYRELCQPVNRSNGENI